MSFHPALLQSIEQLGYRVTVGDVAARAGLEVQTAQQSLLTLAGEAGGHLQVADTGEIVYLFPKDFRSILVNKYWKLQFQQWLGKLWKAIFFLIRVSFGIVLILSIAILFLVVIAVVILSLFRDSDSGGEGGGSGGDWNISFPSGGFWWIFMPDFGNTYYERQEIDRKTETPTTKSMNFLEAIFSFLFGDGNPNFNLEERRWQEIGTVIQNNNGAVIAQQIAPYLDNVVKENEETEDYIIPVLARFNGYPQVSDRGEIIYHFPELQVTAKQTKMQAVSSYLRERNWKFSEADSGQIILAIGLGGLNGILALVVGSFLRSGTLGALGSLGVFVTAIYGFLAAYAVSFLAIPLIRYFFLQWRNGRVNRRNQSRQERAAIVTFENPQLREKLQYARQFASQKVITEEDITYSTDREYLEQEIDRSAKIDQEWQRRLESRE
jgi:hypothetical protein